MPVVGLTRAFLNAAAVLAVLTVTGLAGCGDGPTQPGGQSGGSLTPVAQTPEWPSSTPAAENVDERRLSELVGQIRAGQHGRIHSLLIVRNERLILEEYFNGWTAPSAHTQQSITKSVTSLAVGLAIEHGRMQLNDQITSFFPDYQPIAAFDLNKESLTIRDALMMQSGLDWNEDSYAGSPLERMNGCGCDWIRFVLDWPMRERPGSRWQYISGNTIILGAVVGRATGQRIDRFLEEVLFRPMDFREVRWIHGLPDGLPHTGGGLYLRSRDMAKLGSLVAMSGRWQGRQIVSQAWITQSTTTLQATIRSLGGRPATYGYHWWGLPGDVITASGARGQWIFVQPALNLVVVSTAENLTQEAAATQFFYSHILPAVM